MAETGQSPGTGVPNGLKKSQQCQGEKGPYRIIYPTAKAITFAPSEELVPSGCPLDSSLSSQFLIEYLPVKAELVPSGSRLCDDDRVQPPYLAVDIANIPWRVEARQRVDNATNLLPDFDRLLPGESVEEERMSPGLVSVPPQGGSLAETNMEPLPVGSTVNPATQTVAVSDFRVPETSAADSGVNCTDAGASLTMPDGASGPTTGGINEAQRPDVWKRPNNRNEGVARDLEEVSDMAM